VSIMHRSAVDDRSEAAMLLRPHQRSPRNMSCRALETEEPKQQEQVINDCLMAYAHMSPCVRTCLPICLR
jgi:hypothetical protein